jgi:excinuclease ABC subunit B
VIPGKKISTKRGKGTKSSLDPSMAGKDLATLEKAMHDAAQNLDFEQAAAIRDEIKRVRDELFKT